MSKVAKTFAEARRVLDPRPLLFVPKQGGGVPEVAEDPTFYVRPPENKESGIILPGPIEGIKDRLLEGSRDTKMFLSGHVGSGKSTNLSLLASDPEVRKRFTVVMLRFEEQEWATLDASQVLFRLAGALFKYGTDSKRLVDVARWRKSFSAVNQMLFDAPGVVADEGKLAAEFNLVFFKVSQELKLSEKRRKQFRELGETLQSILMDLLREVANDIENNLARDREPAELLVIVDDLDKVRGAEQQKDIFETHLNSLLVPPFRVVYTVPTGVTFGVSRAEVRQNGEHVYPVKILEKVSSRDPDDAYRKEAFPFFLDVIHKRVDPALIEEEAIRLAAVFSAGVLRDFFHLLRRAIQLAQFNKLDLVDATTMRATLRDQRLRDSAGLNAPDFEALALIHERKQLNSDGDRHYLDDSRVVEFYDDQVWVEVNPLLWQLLQLPAKNTGVSLPPATMAAEHSFQLADSRVAQKEFTRIDELHLYGVGPAARMDVRFAPRLTLITGDNSAGKTFVLDVLWWTLTSTWTGPFAWPRKNVNGDGPATITAKARENLTSSSSYSAIEEQWIRPPEFGISKSLVIYARVDGGISICDPLRNRQTGLGVDDFPPAYNFSLQNLWEGLGTSSATFCNGIVRDLVDWQYRRKDLFELLSRVLGELSPSEEPMKLGEPLRISMHDARDYPTIEMPYGAVPIVHASAAVKRILGLGYLLVWAWHEHDEAARLAGLPRTEQIVLLFDEPEAHLHPFWQRRILSALFDTVKKLSDTVAVQIVASTHSPLVTASVEPLFDPELDKLLHFYVEQGGAVVNEISWAKQGDVSNWLVSETFGLRQARSQQAERTIEAAKAFMRGAPLTPLDTREIIERELLRVLPGHDEFWARWLVGTGEVK